jgi:integrase
METGAYSAKEIELILAALETVTGREQTSARVAQMIVSLCFWAGLRPSEAAGLDWKDVPFGENYIHVCQVFVSGKLKLATKTDEARDVPMVPQIRHRLKLWHDESTRTGLVFQNRSGDAININDLSSRSIAKALKKAGLEWRGLYAARRGHGTELYNHGSTLEEIAAVMGNSPEVAFKNYVKDKSRTAAKGVAKWAAALAGEPVSENDRLLIAAMERQ